MDFYNWSTVVRSDLHTEADIQRQDRHRKSITYWYFYCNNISEMLHFSDRLKKRMGDSRDGAERREGSGETRGKKTEDRILADAVLKVLSFFTIHAVLSLRAHIGEGVLIGAAHCHTKMQVCTRRDTGRAHGGDRLALGYGLSLTDIGTAAVLIDGIHTIVMGDHNIIAHGIVVADGGYSPPVCRIDIRSCCCGNIDSLMERRSACCRG